MLQPPWRDPRGAITGAPRGPGRLPQDGLLRIVAAEDGDGAHFQLAAGGAARASPRGAQPPASVEPDNGWIANALAGEQPPPQAAPRRAQEDWLRMRNPGAATSVEDVRVSMRSRFEDKDSLRRPLLLGAVDDDAG